MRTPRFLQLDELDPAALAAEAIAGITAHPAKLAPKFFYDAIGARLFDAITELPEYYPTRTEAAIVAAHGDPIAAAVRERIGTPAALVDLGAGSCTKAAAWFDRLAPARYVAVDIAASHLRQALDALQRAHPAIDLVGVGCDFSTRLALPVGLVDGPSLIFYPGSSIGNFAPDDALRLLREARVLAAGGALLIGVDLAKPLDVLAAAYDDPLGLTAVFNLNLLRHVNRLAGTDFDVRDWRHVAGFDAARSCVTMHLEARRAHAVRWPGGERRFDAGERIHTEDSFKWHPADFEALLHDAGWRRVRTWTDPQRWFALMLADAR